MDENNIDLEIKRNNGEKSSLHLGFMITSIVLFTIALIIYISFAISTANLQGAEAFVIIFLIVFLFFADIGFILSFIFSLVGFIRTLVDRKYFRMNKIALIIFSILLALNIGMLIFANTSVGVVIGSLA